MPPVGKIDQLDNGTRADLDRLLVAYRFGRLDEVTAWLREQGCDVSRPTVGRYSKELKDKMEERRDRAYARIEMHRALGGLSDDDRASLMEAGEMAAYDEVLDLLDKAANLEHVARAKLMPDVVKAMTALSGSAKKTAEFRAKIEGEARQKAIAEAADRVADTARAQGLSAEQAQFWRQQVLGIS